MPGAAAIARWVGIDYGKRRIGVAISDHAGRIAAPADTLAGQGAPAPDAAQILAWAKANEADGVVVGLPLNMDGTFGAQAKVSQELANEIRRVGVLKVELWDERLTSFQADEHLSAAGVKPARRRKLRDALAAQVMLQSFLDRRGSGCPRDEPEAGRS